ncbi:MAG: aspartate aminotransferase family protein [Candidatus Omnitrophica bacterium]|nr:aspartate aminotransferase family protein [Candidatus Omnitrophota bacterium]
MKTEQIAEIYKRFVMPTYLRNGIVAEKGAGSTLWDIEGKRYLDFFPGWGVSSLGYCPKPVARAVEKQIKKLIHISNSYMHEPQALLAKALIESSFDGKVFFSNSGAEAVEGAIKLARKWGHPHRYEILTMQRSFHGRTLGALAATGQPKYQEGFQPLPAGFRTVPFNDLEAAIKAVTPQTVAILLEPIQGEGGINVATPQFLKGLRDLCDQRKLLLIFDEIQSGFGRTGRLFAYQHFNIVPDVMLLAKAIAGGLPMGAIVAKRAIADTLTPGTHAATFGGSPLVCAAASSVLETVRQPKFLNQVQRRGEQLMHRLELLKQKHSIIQEVRGKGLMIGVELTQAGAPIVERCRNRGLLINCTQEKILRLLPALTVSNTEIQKALRILDAALT